MFKHQETTKKDVMVRKRGNMNATSISHTQIITIGNANKDTELVAKIKRYQREKNYTSAADAVRALCEYALDMKEVSKKL